MPRQYSNWASEVRKVFIEIGQINVWRTEDIDMTYDDFIRNVKNTLIGLYITEWFREINTKEKLRTYKLYKTVFAYESYLCLNSPQLRKAMSRFRLSSHCLEIEVGRYPPRVPPHRRYCKQCNKAEIEDEYNFLLECAKYDVLRVQFILRYYRSRPSMAKCIELLTECNNDSRLSKSVALYVCKAFRLHT